LTGLLEIVKYVLIATLTISLLALLAYYVVFHDEADP
jgi:hypothetical protein